jgi:phosphoglycerol transferase MdoB-like AlkP superfamily enzyme
MEKNKSNFKYNGIFQFCLVFFTVLGFLFTSLKMPQYGLAFNLIAQVFWLYSAYRAWKQADQIGIFINTIIITAVIIFGILNYWLL